MRKPRRSSAAEAYHWVSVVTTITLEMALPAWLGSKLDDRWQTGSWFAIGGAVLGMTVAMMHLLQLTRTPPSKDESNGTDRK